jgi:hypothetical protein
MQVSDDESFSFTLDHSYAALHDVRPLEREKAIAVIAQSMQTFQGNRLLATRRLKEAVLRLLTEESWASRKAGLQLIRLMFEYGFENKNDRMLEEAVRGQLEHLEARVRQEAGEVLGSMAKLKNGGLLVWERFGEALLASIEDQEERKLKQSGEAGGSEESQVFNPPKANSVMHDTEGWHSLHSSLQAIQHIVEGLSSRFDEPITLENADASQQTENTISSSNSSSIPLSTQSPGFPLSTRLMELLLRLLHHKNRFVRETAHMVISSIFSFETKILRRNGISSSPNSSILGESASRISFEIRDGLIDDFSHVTYAASNSARNFALYWKLRAERSSGSDSKSSIPTLTVFSRLMNPLDSQQDSDLTIFSNCLSTLLPALCLNRYVSQDGLRAFSLQTWKMLVHQEGPKLVSFFLPQIMAFYASLAGHHNASTRETAAYCLGELMKKVDRARGYHQGQFQPAFPSQIRQSLGLLTQDHSWPVRDAACAALANFLQNFQEEPWREPEARDLFRIQEVVQLLVTRLDDPLATVRETASHTLISILDRLARGGDENPVPHGLRQLHLSNASSHSQSLKMKVSEGGKGDDSDDSDSDSDSDSNGDFSMDHSHSDAHGDEYGLLIMNMLRLIHSRFVAFENDPSVNKQEENGEHQSPSFNGSGSHSHTHDPHQRQAGESFFGPISKLIHDNDPELHKEQEIFSCECHANPHHCKAHPLTSTDRHSWEIAQSGLFLLRDLVQHQYQQTTPPIPNSLAVNSIVAKLVKRLIKLVSASRPTFSKYSTWITSLLSTLDSILKVFASKSGLSDELSTKLPWDTLVTPLFELIEQQEAIGTSAVSTTRSLPFAPLAPFPGPFGPSTSMPGSRVERNEVPSRLSHPLPSSSASPHHPAVPYGSPNYASAIKPSLAKASSSMLLIEASLQLLCSIYKLVSRSPFNSLPSASHQKIFKLKCLPIINESQ